MELDFNKIIRLKKIRIEKSELSEEVFTTDYYSIFYR